MGKKSKSNYRYGDSFSRRAKLEGYRSRSALKLKELQKKDHLIKKGMSVLDLGSFPGGWSQVSKEFVGKTGKVVGVDLQKMKAIEGTSFIHKSIIDLETKDFEGILPFDIVLSDMAPNISGISIRDDASMVELLEKIQLSIDIFLKEEGSALIKVFQGESLDKMRIYMKSKFQKVRIRKPISSRSNSRETYILGLDKKK